MQAETFASRSVPEELAIHITKARFIACALVPSASIRLDP
jgi:hypothetical protein